VGARLVAGTPCAARFGGGPESHDQIDMTLRDVILNNFRWKALSLVLAVLTWLAINASFLHQGSPVVPSYHRLFSGVPVTWLAGPSNTNHYKISPELVTISAGSAVSGRELENLQLRDIHAFIDVSDTDDLRQFRRPIQIQLPMDLKVFVESYSPSNVTVERITAPK
jgi:hypothetical protein